MDPKQSTRASSSSSLLRRLANKKRAIFGVAVVLVLCGTAIGYWMYTSQMNLSPGEEYRRSMKAEYREFKDSQEPRSGSLSDKERYYEKLIGLAYRAGEYDGAAEATQSWIDMASTVPYGRYIQLITYRCQAGQTDAAIRAVDAALGRGYEGEALQRLKSTKQQLNSEGCAQWVRVEESQ